MTSYFITGGAGFIGSHLVDRLVDVGEVTVYDNLSSGRREFIESHLSRKGFRFIEADLLDLTSLKQVLPGHDIVFHLAANPDVRLGIQDTEIDLKQGVIASYNVLEAMRLNQIKKLVFASSSTVYGETPAISLAEDYGPLLPISLYGAAKLACEGLISAYCHTFDMQVWLFRFANVVGGRSTHGVISDFIHKLRRNPSELEILGDGRQCKPYLHIDDCVEAILFGLHNAQDRMNLFNLGCTTATNVTTVASMVAEQMGLRDVKFKYTGGDRGWTGDVPQVRFDITRMRELGWEPRYSSDEAVRKATRDILNETK